MRAAVKIYPSYLDSQRFIYRLQSDADCSFTFLRAFLDQFNPIEGEFQQGPLTGLFAQAIDAIHLRQAFFAEFNAAIGIDYLLAFQASLDKAKPEIDYLKRSIDYLYKAVRENNREAEYWLTQLLFDLEKYQAQLCDRELDLWIEERLWHLQTLLSDTSQSDLKKRVELYYQSLQDSYSVAEKSGRPRSSSSVVAREAHFRLGLLANPRLGRSTRNISVVVSTQEAHQGIHWLQHSAPSAYPEQQHYFGGSLQEYQNRSVQLEVFSSELLRVYVGLNQPRAMISVSPEGRYYALSEFIQKDRKKPHLNDDYRRAFSHHGRTLWLRALLDENDGHGLNYIVTPGPEHCVVAIDTDRCFWPYAAIFDGTANEPKESVIPAVAQGVAKDEYSAEEQLLTHQASDDVWERRYHLTRTDDDLGKITVSDYDNFPITRGIMPKNVLFHAGDTEHAIRFQNDAVFKNEQHFIQVKFLCLQLIEKAVADTVFGDSDDIKHYLLFDLKRKRTQQLQILKDSEKFKDFLRQYSNDIAYALIFEVKLLLKDNSAFANNNHYSESVLLFSMIQNYISLLEMMRITVPSYLRGHLHAYQVDLCSNELEGSRHAITRLQNTVLPFYQNTGMKLEERTCKAYCQDLEERKQQLQIAENQRNPRYMKAIDLVDVLKKQRARMDGVDFGIDFSLLDNHERTLTKMLSDVTQARQIHWIQYDKPLEDIEAYLKHAQIAADLTQVYRFAKIYAHNNQHSSKGLIFKNLLVVIEAQIRQLITAPSEEVVSNAKKITEFCAFVLSRRRHEVIDDIRVAFNKLQNAFRGSLGLQQQRSVDGPEGFKEWQTGLEAAMESKVLNEAFQETVKYNKNTTITVNTKGQTTHSNWASFYQACRPLLTDQADISLIQSCSIAACAA